MTLKEIHFLRIRALFRALLSLEGAGSKPTENIIGIRQEGHSELKGSLAPTKVWWLRVADIHQHVQPANIQVESGR